ncbi:MAG: glutathionylspermidine synthase family protein [Sphingomonadaceae bacterium]|nr:glutathionylspermidine synthase family protein [Sphingomonadaceae bacterium]
MTMTPRPGWPARVQELGLVWHSDEQPYWDERAAYVVSAAEVATLERAGAELHRLYLEAGQAVIDRGWLDRLHIPAHAHDAVRRSWEAEPPALNFGRFDLGWTGAGEPKLFEFNADTPTCLLEAAVIQWDWKEAVAPGCDQYNAIHDALVAQWREIAPRADAVLHIAHAPNASGEDEVTAAYIADTAREAGLAPVTLTMEAIGWDTAGQRFVDQEGRAIDACFKLYPWEWMIGEAFAPQLLDPASQTVWIEPAWKLMFSNKAMLAVLWELNPGHPNLLEASCEPLGMRAQVRKPVFGREGANVSIARGGEVSETAPGPYEGPYVYQALYDLPGHGDERPVLGLWSVDGAPVGLGIREGGAITGNSARFVPHLIEG